METVKSSFFEVRVRPAQLLRHRHLCVSGLVCRGNLYARHNCRHEVQVDSYRVTYRYQFYESERWRLKLGVTAFVRDAKVELSQQGVTASDSDIGVVPLLSANIEYALAPRWTALVDFDGLVSPQGRAIDAAAKIRYDLTDKWYVSAGYRVFEGGVDNDERFAFAWYNFAVVSLGVRF